MAKGKLPVTGFLKIEGNTDQWGVLAKGLIKDLHLTALLDNNGSGKTVRIKLHIMKIFSPDSAHWTGQSSVAIRNTENEDLCLGFEKNRNFLMAFIMKKSWILLGYIEGEEPIPVLVEYFENLELMIYTQKTEKQTAEEFFPKGFSPSLN